jgi:hypothetical protein
MARVMPPRTFSLNISFVINYKEKLTWHRLADQSIVPAHELTALRVPADITGRFVDKQCLLTLQTDAAARPLQFRIANVNDAVLPLSFADL